MKYAIEILRNELDSYNKYIRACQREIDECKGGVNLSEAYKNKTINDNNHLMALAMDKVRDIEKGVRALENLSQ